MRDDTTLLIALLLVQSKRVCPFRGQCWATSSMGFGDSGSDSDPLESLLKENNERRHRSARPPLLQRRPTAVKSCPSQPPLPLHASPWLGIAQPDPQASGMAQLQLLQGSEVCKASQASQASKEFLEHRQGNVGDAGDVQFVSERHSEISASCPKKRRPQPGASDSAGVANGNASSPTVADLTHQLKHPHIEVALHPRFATAVAGVILRHCTAYIDQLLDRGPTIYKIGATWRPEHRWTNNAYGYRLDVDRWDCMHVLHAARSEPIGFLEASLIAHYKDQRPDGLRNQAPGGEGIGQSNLCYLYVVSRLLPQPPRGRGVSGVSGISGVSSC